MDIIEFDFDWFKYEGKIISDDYIKYILRSEEGYKNKEIIMNQIFNKYDLHNFYVLSVSIDNLYNYVCYCHDFAEPIDVFLINSYIRNKNNLKDVITGDIRNYVLTIDKSIYTFKYCIDQIKKLSGHKNIHTKDELNKN